MPLVERCLRSVLAQETPWPFEVIVVDSESTDGTWELVEALPVVHISIQPQDFNHGKTRNLGASMAKGEILVFLVQDAVPVDNFWLQHLVTAVELPNVAGSYGRELPWPSDNPLIRLNMQQTLPQCQEQVRQSLSPSQTWDNLSPQEKFELAMFHDTCSCMRYQVWLKYPFNHLPYGEDLDWGGRVIQAGYTIIYEPRATVYHSHDRSGWYVMKRAYADHELVVRLFDYHVFPRLKGLIASWMSSSRQFIQTIYTEPGSLSEKLRLILRTPVIVGARHWGSYIGARAAKPEMKKGILWQYIDNLMRKGV
jgi:rhamnosyltransferase